MKTTALVFGTALLLAGTALAAPALSPDMAEPAMQVKTPAFVEIVTSSNQFEIRSSRLAEQKATDPALEQFAARMVADHTEAGEKLDSTLTSIGTAAPPASPELAPKHARMLSQLEAASGADFDMLYLDMQAQAHREAVSLFRTFSGSGDTPAVVAFAKATLPTLEMHKEHVKDLIAKE